MQNGLDKYRGVEQWQLVGLNLELAFVNSK
jgi:hypothetical protein